MIRPILKIHNPDDLSVLRSVCKPVESFDDELKRLAADMVETMWAANGAGLAAPQVGVNVNMFVMMTQKSMRDRDNKETLVVINPTTTIKYKDTFNDNEGCLSIPNLYGKVVRYREIGGSYMDLDGNRQEIGLSGFLSRCWQHEADHLVGKLYTDLATDLCMT